MLVDRSGWWTPWVTVFLGYTFIGLDEVTAELEDPFGVEANDLPLAPALEPDSHFVLR